MKFAFSSALLLASLTAVLAQDSSSSSAAPSSSSSAAPSSSSSASQSQSSSAGGAQATSAAACTLVSGDPKKQPFGCVEGAWVLIRILSNRTILTLLFLFLLFLALPSLLLTTLNLCKVSWSVVTLPVKKVISSLPSLPTLPTKLQNCTLLWHNLTEQSLHNTSTLSNNQFPTTSLIQHLLISTFHLSWAQLLWWLLPLLLAVLSFFKRKFKCGIWIATPDLLFILFVSSCCTCTSFITRDCHSNQTSCLLSTINLFLIIASRS